MRQLPSALLLGFLLPGLAAAQSTVGFSDPDELTALLEYRLPDWGWQTWDLAGQFSGTGSSYRFNGDTDLESETARNANNAQLKTRFELWRESERRDLRLGLECGGSWSRSHAGMDDQVSRDRSLNGYYSVSGGIDVRPSGGPWSVTASAVVMGDYHENRREWRSEDFQDENVEIARGHGHQASLGIGLGRIRDVTPLVRAERLNERLVALGRPRLAPAAVQHVAWVLAREYGYRRVFDRPERRFWSDVLEPLIGGEPLSVAEVFYLTDVMQEDLGTRWQGARVQSDVLWYQGGLGDGAVYEPGVALSGMVARNLSLALQLRGYVGGQWSESRQDSQDAERRSAWLGGDLLWNVADRLRLDADVRAELTRYDWASDVETSEETRASVVNEVRLEFYLEDRLSLQPYAALSWYEGDVQAPVGFHGRGWFWGYGLTFHYRLDGLLF